MKPYVICKAPRDSMSTFYLVADGEEYYLFRQNFRKGVNGYYRYGVLLDESINQSRNHGDEALIHTMNKILSCVKYVEKEYDIAVLDRTKRKDRHRSVREDLLCA